MLLMRRVLALGLLAGAILVPTAARAAGVSTNPFTPGIPQATPTATAPSTAAPTIVSTSGSTGGSGLSSSTAITVFIGAILLIVGISFFIWRDARRRAPVRQRAAEAERAKQSAQARAKQKPRKLSPAERRRRKRGRAR
jgi:hypothetical protein